MRLLAVVLPALVTVSNAQFDLGEIGLAEINGIAQGIAGLPLECFQQTAEFPPLLQEFLNSRKEKAKNCGDFMKGIFRATLNRSSLGPGDVAGFRGLRNGYCSAECSELVAHTQNFMLEVSGRFSACTELIKAGVSTVAGMSGGIDIALGGLGGGLAGAAPSMVFDTLSSLKDAICSDECGGLTDIPCWICKGASMVSALPIDAIMGLIPAGGGGIPNLPVDPTMLLSDVCNFLPFCENDGGGCKRKAAYECNGKETLRVMKNSFRPVQENCEFPLEKDTCSNANCQQSLTGMKAMMAALTKGTNEKWVPGRAALCAADLAGEMVRDIVANVGDGVEDAAKGVAKNVGDIMSLVLQPGSAKENLGDLKNHFRERAAAKQTQSLAKCEVKLEELEGQAEAEYAALMTKDSELLFQALQDDNLLETDDDGSTEDSSPSVTDGADTSTGPGTGGESAGTMPYPVAAPLLTAAALMAVAAQ